LNGIDVLNDFYGAYDFTILMPFFVFCTWYAGLGLQSRGIFCLTEEPAFATMQGRMTNWYFK
jgi:hypothetical protein